MKNELQVHLNALKGYVDMKFDVLKGMMSTGESDVADKMAGPGRRLGESDSTDSSDADDDIDSFASLEQYRSAMAESMATIEAM
jgi:hypothetical protein